MKKQLLLTMTAILASLTISSQAIITSTAEDQTFNVGNAATALPGYSIAITSGTESIGSNYVQINGSTTDSDSVLSFDLQGSAETTAKLTMQIRLFSLNTGTATITIGGGTPETFILDLNSPYFTAGGFDIYDLPIAAPLELSNGVNTPVTVAVTGAQGGQASINRARYYSAKITDKVTETLATNSFELKSFQVFPNPITDSFQINTEESIKSLSLFNVTGQLVKTFTASENYDISDFNPGVYFATVTSEIGSQTIKIVKK
ncbi:T9SS type A sorting domain-containing protein [Algibacter sp. L3A6]|uniref:T9SS type A sorting domain-containing protein n=1 Tax=Algibacter sp. L3A6 TaxID=2686366 RepID=UPI00131C6D37|nr:T9SS type A sorting domain-containing protein [Algibacter sp. L3A6]